MASPQENVSMAVFCDFENVALGVRDAKIDRFDIKPVLERLLLKGSIVVKKAYCDWERYKGFKASMHEASFELIEIPHVRQSGKNSADIRLVVDALDLCYTKSHVDTFVIVSGDSDFSPLVSKLRENAKKVIGVGVRHSTSDLLVANCDEFIFYDDLVRELGRESGREQQARGKGRGDSNANAKRKDGDERQQKGDSAEDRGEERKLKAITMVVETLDALGYERGDSGKIWASVLKSAIKRRRPDFNEARYGFRAFGNLLEEAQARGLLEVGRDDKSGTFVTRTSQPESVAADVATSAASAPEAVATPVAEDTAAPRQDDTRSRRKGRRNGRGNAKDGAREARQPQQESKHEAAHEAQESHESQEVVQTQEIFDIESLQETEAAHAHSAQLHDDLFIDEEPQPLSHESALPLFETAAPARRARKTAARKSPARKKAAKPAKDVAQADAAPFDVEVAAQPEPVAEATPETVADAPKKKAARKTPARPRRPRKTAEES
ncbi:NYN domain-containing protein [Burkholderia sp. Ax-1719]|uniref:NYN domain-containing protein n=1 Tax=Burkholderia sp. Ax-1719 TaxID=2608334 RepID=UPI00141F3170|nr:NYN domain-containing protein [Burkholderia sp. Ax-1719]NIE65029.1 NYN domain-containing protein [Burkholderia sp. Ax-1719]